MAVSVVHSTVTVYRYRLYVSRYFQFVRFHNETKLELAARRTPLKKSCFRLVKLKFVSGKAQVLTGELTLSGRYASKVPPGVP